MEILFTSERTHQRADEILDYLRGPRLWIPHLDYPDFDAWADKVHWQLKSEEKRACIGLVAGAVVGAVIYQRHKTEPDTLEIKNVTVRPDMRGRYIANFLLRNAEIEGVRDFGGHQVIVDAKARNFAIRSYLFRNGYRVRKVEDLYGLGAGRDVVYHKAVGKLIRPV